MTSDLLSTSVPSQPQPALPAPAAVARRPRVWPAIVLTGLFWALYAAVPLLELSMFASFLIRLGVCALVWLLFLGWWVFHRSVSRTERFVGLVVLVGIGVGSGFLLHKSIPAMAWSMYCLPLVLTAWALWLVVSRWLPAWPRVVGMLGVFVLTFGAFTLIRMEGLGGDGQSVFHWRWTPDAEERYRAWRAQHPEEAMPAHSGTLQLQPGDSPDFRGVDRTGVIGGTRLATNWDAAPPQLLWKKKVGPAWSSVLIVDGCLFTQEQRDQSEAVVCLDAASGKEIWVHEDPVRFEEQTAGAGPRATPHFAAGRLYTLGGTGILNCLDATTGKRHWSQNIGFDAGVKLPLWGFTSSPLVVKGMVVVYAGGQGNGESTKTLLAYHADSGELAWTADAGKMSYSSPQRVTLAGVEQVLFLGDLGLTAYDPVKGSVLWEYKVPSRGPGLPRSVQPHLVGTSQILIGSEGDFGTILLGVDRDGDSWKVEQRWRSRELRPPFNDCVIHEGFIYGFDKTRFCCLDAQTGKGRWKDGDYGQGQVMLLADQGLLLVASESGDAVVLAANPERHEELGRIQAVSGKTWNHPVVAHGKLYLRSNEELACFQLPEKEGK